MGLMDPMDSPPADHGSDRYDYVEVINAPPGVAPHGEWWERMLAMPCPDCRANVFATYQPEVAPPQMPWSVQIAHDEGCPALARIEAEQ